MNRIIQVTKKTLAMATLVLAMPMTMLGANTTVTVSQVTSAVTLSADQDYVITSSTPFATAGSVNITNTEHAVVIIKTIKPSKVISSWLKTHVYINGVQAVNGTNCQVKMYSHGAIIFPYSSSIKPLTVYSEQNYGGTSVNDFGLENDGGFMNTLTDAKLNNQIRSFKLKRGYMVTFSTRKGGRGYSRCFIADKADLEISKLPTVLDKHITSYRIFQWQNAKKAGLASDTRAAATDATNASWCYSWGLGENRYPDTECVPNHIYEDWPSPAACGGVTYSCHLKTNNEPGNSSDDHPQDVATVLANWENLMRTGFRLCSESSHDGSMSHLKAFMDSIDARGWRCDLVDLHCYWDTGTFNNLTWYSNYYGNGRPIWISEWVWGASWSPETNRTGFWAKTSTPNECSASNQTICYNGTKPILDVLNSNTRVERYAYWNSEAAGTHIYDGTSLTTLGKYYADMNDDLGYNAADEFIPKTPRQYTPSGLSATYDKKQKKVTLTWHDENGEYNQTMVIQVKRVGFGLWSNLQTVDLQEDAADYSVTIDGIDGNKYRIRILDLNSKERYSNEATAVSETLEYGDEISVSSGTDIKTMYLGGNMLINGDFSMGTTDWTNGKGETIKAPYFQVVPEGGVDNSAYLQCYGSSTEAKAESSVRKVMKLQPKTSYYVSATGCNNTPERQRISTAATESLESNVHIALPAVTDWTRQGNSFTVGSDSILMIQFRELGGKAQFDDVKVCRLYDTEAEAMADALAWEKKRVETFVAYNTEFADINTELNSLASISTNANELEESLLTAMAEVKERHNKVLRDAVTTDLERSLSQSADSLYTLNTTAIRTSDFSSTSGWTTKCGTYTGGDQRTATQAGKTCWNAWWNISASNTSSTMEVKQTVSGLSHGLYALQCKATTQHLCETDQHAYISNGEDVALSPALPLGKLDLPCFADADKWCTLATSYVYVNDGDVVTVGFTGSKKGAVDKSWMAYASPTSTGDNREGWWCATDFYLRCIPMYKKASDASSWGTICLTRAITPPVGVTLYKVAGILSDQSAVCLEPVTEATVAGCPYIYHMTDDSTNLFFLESGDAVETPKTNVGGLRGSFETAAAITYNVGSLVLKNGVWTYTTEGYQREAYSGYIQRISKVTVLDSWAGVKLPASGIPEGTVVSGITNVLNDESTVTSPTYDLQGRKTDKNYKGVVVSKSGKRVIK